MGVRFQVLGPLRAWREECELALGPPKQRVVLGALLLNPCGRVSTSEISSLLWGESPPPTAVNTIQTYVKRLRGLLQPERLSGTTADSMLRRVHGGYSLMLDEDSLDLLRFRLLLSTAKHEGSGAVPAEVLTMFHGLPLEDLSDYPRTDANLAAVEQELITAMVVAARAPDRYDHAELITGLEGLARHYPLSEPLHAALMRVYNHAGRQAEALVVFEQIRRRLGDELGADPGEELRCANMEALTQRPIVASPGSRWRGRRAAAGPLIGRADELRQVTELVRERRLVTLTGPGGVGKTSLALEVAARAQDAHRDGVAVIELGALSSRHALGEDGTARLDAVTDTIRRRLGPLGDPDGSAADLITALQGRQLLIVLDNAEHVASVIASWTDEVRRSCDGVRFVITSRRSLGLPGETVWEVSPLSLPSAGAHDTDMCGHGAVDLFLTRAGEQFPLLDLSDDLGDVAEVCRKLDGLPLAIELAVARLRSIPIAALRTRLEHPGALGERLAPGLPHQLALGATIRWSLDLLSRTDMLVLARLSAFSGSFTLDAAEQLHGPVMSGQVVLALANLVDSSLVQPVRGHDYRYRILTPIRDFCRTELGATEYRVTRDRHLAYFSDLAKSAEEHADASVLHPELAEIVAALEWGFREGTSGAVVVRAVELLTAARPLWDRGSGHTQLLRHWTECALSHESSLHLHLRAKLYHWAGRLAYVAGRFPSARAHLAKALSLTDLGDRDGERRRADIMIDLAAIADALLDSDAMQRAHAAVVAAENAGDPSRIVAARVVEASTAAWRDRAAEADTALRKAYEVAGADAESRTACLSRQPLIDLRAGRLDEAVKSADRVLALRTELGPDAAIHTLLCKAWALVLRGAATRAIAPLDEARTLCDEVRRPCLAPQLNELEAHVHRALGRVDDARLAAAQTIRAAMTGKDLATALRALHIVAAIAVQEHDPGARDIVVSVASCRVRAGYPPWPFTSHECSLWEEPYDTASPQARRHTDDLEQMISEAAERALAYLDDCRGVS
ncbi:BTAD domain-containing putative transcriptional regulator [Sphaerisporangium sp. NPDC005289]|uniref:AfsR/SARP family transcriptional regulator n=1 Tax=Sphaerisporangium sp. NPDC005289 TaxID=3155247 RepID=UPI0033B07875